MSFLFRFVLTSFGFRFQFHNSGASSVGCVQRKQIQRTEVAEVQGYPILTDRETSAWPGPGVVTI